MNSLVGGSVSLPMPQSFSEKKGVEFGADTMNSGLAGVTQDVLGNMDVFPWNGIKCCCRNQFLQFCKVVWR